MSIFGHNWSLIRQLSDVYLTLILSQVIAMNAAKHLIDQSEERILLIDQSKNASKHS